MTASPFRFLARSGALLFLATGLVLVAGCAATQSDRIIQDDHVEQGDINLCQATTDRIAPEWGVEGVIGGTA